jgi:glc operon protein GlcG
MRRLMTSLAAVVLATITSRAGSQVMDKKILTLDGAKQVIAAGIAEAKKNNAAGVIAVVDDGGNLMALERLDGTFAAGANVSIGKARTAAIFKKPTSFFENVIKNGRTAMTALPDFTPLQGGVPIVVDGQIVGAVGVSGASSAQQDEEFANVAANAVTSAMVSMMSPPASQETTLIQSTDVSAAFAKGVPLVENEQFKVHASRREKPGQAEVHDHETDIIYVVQGTAALVTGGTVVDGKTTAPGETRGVAIDGGEVRTLVQGDVVIVPKGTPHWFKSLGHGPFLYYVVKVIS